MRFLKKWAWRVLLALVLLVLAYEGWTYWQVWRLVDHNPQRTAVMAQRLAEMEDAGRPARIDYRWVEMTQISRYLQRALIASEDATFYAHEGFDWEGIKVAAQKNIKQGKVVAGGSTITQQLAKNLFLSTHRNVGRKGQEVVVTVMLEHTLEKQRIFEIYLNVIEWGDGIFGAEAAARHYFKKSAARLSPKEAAWLAAIVPNPRFYDENRSHRRAAKKARIILARMAVRYGRSYNEAPRVVNPSTAPKELNLPPDAAEELLPQTLKSEEPAPLETPPPVEEAPAPTEPVPVEEPVHVEEVEAVPAAPVL